MCARTVVGMQLRGEPRMNAAAKDSEWVRQRQQLERSMPADVNEIALVATGAPAHVLPQRVPYADARVPCRAHIHKGL